MAGCGWGWQEASTLGTLALDTEGGCIDLIEWVAQATDLCLSHGPGPFARAPGSSSQFWLYKTRPAPSSAGQAFSSPRSTSAPLSGPLWGARAPASWERPPGGLEGELTLAPHLGLTSLCAEVTSRGLPGMTSSHNPSVTGRGSASQVGEVSSFKEESHRAGQGSWGLSLRDHSVNHAASRYSAALQSCDGRPGQKLGAEG